MSFDICAECGVDISDKNLGGEIKPDERIVCKDCYDKHIHSLIDLLENFRKSDNFHSQLKLREIILRISEEMANWHDAGDKSYLENVTDYDSFSLDKLKGIFLDHEITLIEDLLNYKDIEMEIDLNFKPELHKLRKELLEKLRGLPD